MLVPADLSTWLRAEAAVDGGRLQQGGMVELPEAAGASIMSGQAVAKVLAGRMSELGSDAAAEVRLLKQLAAQRGQGVGSGNAPSERLYSWNMLSPLLARFGVGLSADDKTLIVAGDEEVRSARIYCASLVLLPDCPCPCFRKPPALRVCFRLALKMTGPREISARQIVVNLLQELKDKLPAHKHGRAADANARRSMSQRGYSARAPQTSYSQPSHRPPDALRQGGNGSRHPYSNTPAVPSRMPQYFSEAPVLSSAYGLNAAAHAQPGGGAPAPLFPPIAGGIPPQPSIHSSYNTKSSREGMPRGSEMPSGPFPVMMVPANSNYEGKLGSYGNYGGNEGANGGYSNVGAMVGGGAPAPPARYEESLHFANNAGVGHGVGGQVGALDVRQNGGAIDVRQSGMGMPPGAAGARIPQGARVLAGALAASLSMSPSEAAAALAESRQPLVRRFLAEGMMLAAADRGGQAAEKFLKTLEVQLPPVLANVGSVSAGVGGLGAGVEEDVALVLTTAHWGMLSRWPTVALQSCRVLTSIAALLQQPAAGGGAGWNGAGGGSAVNRLVWAWLSARVSPPVGGAIGAVLSMLRQHGVAGEHAGNVAGALAMFMYELSGQGLGMRQLLAIEIPARAGAGRGGGLLLLSKVVEAMQAHSPTTREAVLRSGALVELSHTSMRDASGSGGAAAAAAAAATGGPAAVQAAVEEIQGGALELLVTLWIAFPNEMLDLQGGGDISRTASAGGGGKEKLWSLLRGAMAPKAAGAAHGAGADSGETSGEGAAGPGSKLQLRAHALLFRLLESFIAAKSPDSSTAYRAVVSSLLEHYGQEDVRNLVQTSLGRVLEKTPRMPLGILVEPLMKQVRAWGYTPADLVFHNVLARHPRLEPAQGLMILDMMARVCVADDRPDCRQSAGKCLAALLDILRDVPSAADFVDRLGRLVLGIASVVAAPDGSSAVTRVPSGAGGSMSIGVGAAGSQVPLARKVAMVRLVDCIAKLHSPAYNKHLHAHLLEALTRKEQLVPELACEFEALADTLSGKAPKGDALRDRAASAKGPRGSSPALDTAVSRGGAGGGGGEGSRAKHGRAGERGKDLYAQVRGSDDSVLRSEKNTPRAEGSPPPDGPPLQPPTHGDAGGGHGAAAADKLAPLARVPSGGSKGKGRRRVVGDGGEGAPNGAEEQERQKGRGEKEAAKEAKVARQRERALKEEEERLRLEEEEKRGPKMSAEERRAGLAVTMSITITLTVTITITMFVAVISSITIIPITIPGVAPFSRLRVRAQSLLRQISHARVRSLPLPLHLPQHARASRTSAAPSQSASITQAQVPAARVLS